MCFAELKNVYLAFADFVNNANFLWKIVFNFSEAWNRLF